MKKIAIRLRIKPPQRRSPSQRLRARLYYRKNRARIRMQRRRYLRTHRSQIKHRKMFMRYKPTWFKKTKHSKPKKPHFFAIKVPRHKTPKPSIFKVHKPVHSRPPAFKRTKR